MKTKTKLHYKSAKTMLEDPALKAKIASDKQAAAENLAAVSGQRWFTCENGSLGTLQRDGDDGPDLDLGAGKEFSVTGKKMAIMGVHCQDVVTKAGARGWVTEMELRTYTTMAERR